jgi:hypothetical protein
MNNSAPPRGFEPRTFFLTGSRSTVELQGNEIIRQRRITRSPTFPDVIGITWGILRNSCIISLTPPERHQSSLEFYNAKLRIQNVLYLKKS